MNERSVLSLWHDSSESSSILPYVAIEQDLKNFFILSLAPKVDFRFIMISGP